MSPPIFLPEELLAKTSVFCVRVKICDPVYIAFGVEALPPLSKFLISLAAAMTADFSFCAVETGSVYVSIVHSDPPSHWKQCPVSIAGCGGFLATYPLGKYRLHTPVA